MHGKVHPGDEMTSRERLLAAYRGREVDRLPFWAKVANPTWRLSQPREVRDLSERELLDFIHADGLFGLPAGLRVHQPRVSVETHRRDHSETRITHTPDGDLTEQWRQDPATESWHPTDFPVKCRQDLERFRWVYADVRVEVDGDALAAAKARTDEIGPRGITHTGFGTSPLMHLVQHVIGPIDTAYMLFDHPGPMDELMELMHQVHLAKAKCVAESTPADVIISGENTSTTLISPQQFEKYCYRHLCDYGRAIQSAGKMHELHMCGHLRALLERIDAIPADSIEAFTSPTLGNTRLADGRKEAASKTLVGGTNVNVWLWPAERIRQYILTELAACPDNRRIVLTTAGVAPPGCPAEKFRQIGQWIPSVPVKL